MKHLKPYNKIYSIMCGVVRISVCERVLVYSCFRLVWDYRVLSFTCLKDVSKYAATFTMFFSQFFFHTFFVFFFFRLIRFFFSTSKGLVFMYNLWTERFDTAVIILGAYAHLSPRSPLEDRRAGYRPTHTFPLVRVTRFLFSSRIVICII